MYFGLTEDNKAVDDLWRFTLKKGTKIYITGTHSPEDEHDACLEAGCFSREVDATGKYQLECELLEDAEVHDANFRAKIKPIAFAQTVEKNEKNFKALMDKHIKEKHGADGSKIKLKYLEEQLELHQQSMAHFELQIANLKAGKPIKIGKMRAAKKKATKYETKL